MNIEVKPKDLRLGNLIRAKSPELTTYEEPVSMDLAYLTMFYKIPQKIDILGIPLTEEWLLKFEAKKTVLTGIDSMIYYDLGNLTICDWGNGLYRCGKYLQRTN